jgi:murein DD-endopeptidase MepM/ murein hydrolase activator NlpD
LVVIKTTKVNGVTTNQEVLSSTVLKDAVNEVVAVGTKVIYYAASRGTSAVSTQGFIRPCIGIVTSNYGWRWRSFHSGVDFAASTGTPVTASKAGTVVYSGWKGSLGYCIIIDHGNGVQTLYGHNSRLIASVGSYVTQGQTVALMGSTGRSTGPHCHFEVRVNGISQNPWNYID